MALVKKPTRPLRGDDVQDLWNHVDRLCDIVEAQATEIAALKARLGPRRATDGNIVLVKCCSDDHGEVYLPVYTAGQPYTQPPATPATVEPITTVPPDGNYLLK